MNLQQIFLSHSTQVQHVLQGGEVDGPLFDVLFDFFCNIGEMPYGTATAKDGDPYEWIERRIHEIADSVEVYDRTEFPLGA